MKLMYDKRTVSSLPESHADKAATCPVPSAASTTQFLCNNLYNILGIEMCD